MRADRCKGTEFVNKNLTDYYESVGITHEKTVPRLPTAEWHCLTRRNRTSMLSCSTNADILHGSLVSIRPKLWLLPVTKPKPDPLNHTLHNKTPYELVHRKETKIPSFQTKGYRIYNKRTRQIMETIHVTFDELTEQTAPVHSSSGPAPNLLTPGPISSGLVPNSALLYRSSGRFEQALLQLHHPLALMNKSCLALDRITVVNKVSTDKQRFNLTKDTLIDALRITPSTTTRLISSPPNSGYLLSLLSTNRAKAPVLQISWASSIELNEIIRKGCGRKHSIHPYCSTEDKIIWHNIHREKESPLRTYPAGEEVSDPNSPAPKPAKSTKPRRKRKQAKETSEANRQAKRAKAGKVVKKRTLKRSQHLVDEGIPLTEPGFGDLEADTQRAIEESLKDAQGAPRGPFPPVVFRETDTGKFQPLPECIVNGKREKVGCGASTQVSTQSSKLQIKSGPAGTYIFQRRTSAPTEPSGHDESPSLYVELGLTESDIESDEEMPLVVKSGDQDEGQARPDPGIQDKGQAEPNPDDVAESQPLSTPGENLKLTVNEPVIPEEPARSTRTLSPLQHLAKDFSFGDQFFNDKPSEADNEKTTADIEAESMVSVTIHQDTSAIPPMTSPVIDLVSRPDSPNVHRPLPTTATATATTTTTIKTLPLPPQPQQGPSYPSLLKHIGELEQHIADLVDANQALEERLDKHGSRLYRLENQDIPNQVRKAVDGIVTDAVDWAIQAPLRERFRDLPEADMKEILHNRMWESKSYQTHEDHMMLYEALEKSMARDNCDQLLSDLAEATKKKKKRQGSPKTPPGSPPHPPPPPPPAGPSGTSGASGASGSSQSPPPPPPLSNNQGGQFTSTAAPSSSKIVASAEYTAWMTTDTRIKSSISPIPEELYMDDDTTADEQAYLSSGEDVRRDHIPTVNLRQSWWKPLTEDRPATPEPAWSIPSSALTIPTNN
ncbi:hypothetical protein Tco_0731730 [Tanacetum coccineum]